MLGLCSHTYAAEETSEVSVEESNCIDDPETSGNECESDESDVIFDLSKVEADDYSQFLVWGVGIAILSSVGSDSGTGTATTD